MFKQSPMQPWHMKVHGCRARNKQVCLCSLNTKAMLALGGCEGLGYTSVCRLDLGFRVWGLASKA